MNSGWNTGSVFDCPSVCELTAALLDCFVSQSHLHEYISATKFMLCQLKMNLSAKKREKNEVIIHAYIYI